MESACILHGCFNSRMTTRRWGRGYAYVSAGVESCGRKRYRKSLKQTADFPTWGQLKKLTEGDAVIWLARKPWNVTILFLAMLSVITGTKHAYWAYIHNSPINKKVSWGDRDIPVVVSESSCLPFAAWGQPPAAQGSKGNSWSL